MLWFETQNSAPWKPWVKSSPTDEQFTVSVSKKAARLSLGSFLSTNARGRRGDAGMCVHDGSPPLIAD